MNRITFVLALGALIAAPAFAAADHHGCGCDALPTASACENGCGCEATCNPCDDCCCERTRTRLRLVRVSKEVCRRARVCTTDCCGCPTTKRVRVSKCVTRLRLQRVEVAPRQRCCAPAPCNDCCDPCPTSCGCN